MSKQTVQKAAQLAKRQLVVAWVLLVIVVAVILGGIWGIFHHPVTVAEPRQQLVGTGWSTSTPRLTDLKVGDPATMKQVVTSRRFTEADQEDFFSRKVSPIFGLICDGAVGGLSDTAKQALKKDLQAIVNCYGKPVHFEGSPGAFMGNPLVLAGRRFDEKQGQPVATFFMFPFIFRYEIERSISQEAADRWLAETLTKISLDFIKLAAKEAREKRRP